ncbi:MAG: hypothetical protein AAF208_12005 [Cyanobacteria bacterium P01_A01_bin.45]
MSTQPSNKLSAAKRFAFGLIIGLFIAGLFWLYSIYFNVYIPSLQGIIGATVLAISCGAIAVMSGIDKVFDNIPKI